MSDFQVVGIGRARVEHLAVVDRHPEPDVRADLAGYSPQWGGTVATAMSALAQLGVPGRLISKLGDDHFGRFVLDGCEELGIDTTGVFLQAGRISPMHFVILNAETHRRTVLMTEGNVDPLGTGEVDLSVIDQAKVLVLDGTYGAVQVEAAERARKAGTQVVLNASHIAEGMGELVALTDTLIASERYTSEVAPRGELEDSLIEISRLGPRTVVVKLGKEGSIGLQGDKLVQQPPLRVDVVDTTGAGDVFLGGYVFGLVNDEPMERCMQLGSAAAGLSCQGIGAIGGLPSQAAVEEVV